VLLACNYSHNYYAQHNRRKPIAGEEVYCEPECRCASDWFMIACLRTLIGNTTPKTTNIV